MTGPTTAYAIVMVLFIAVGVSAMAALREVLPDEASTAALLFVTFILGALLRPAVELCKRLVGKG